MQQGKDYFELAEDAVKALEEGDLDFYEECIEEMKKEEGVRVVRSVELAHPGIKEIR